MINFLHIKDFFAKFPFLPDMLTEKQRRTLYLQEMEFMAQTAKAKMEDAQSVDMTFLRASHIEHVRPMFRVSVVSNSKLCFEHYTQ